MLLLVGYQLSKWQRQHPWRHIRNAGVACECPDSTTIAWFNPGSDNLPLPWFLVPLLASACQFPHLSNRDANAVDLSGLLQGLNESLHVNGSEQRPAG